MRPDHLAVLALTAMGAAAVGCSGPPAGVVTFTEANVYESDDSNESEAKDAPAPSPSNNQPSAVFASDVYPTLLITCGSCHQSGVSGAPIYFGADAAATYTLFKGKGYQLPNSMLVSKGAHTGPALTVEQKAAIARWATAEGS